MCQYTACMTCKVCVYNKIYGDGSTNCAVCTHRKKEEAEELHKTSMQQSSINEIEKLIEIIKKNNADAMLRAEKALNEVNHSLSIITHLTNYMNELTKKQKQKQVRF